MLRALRLAIEVVPVPLATPEVKLNALARGRVVVKPFDARPARPHVRFIHAVCGYLEEKKHQYFHIV